MLYNIAKAAMNGVMHLFFRIEVNGRENVPSEGAFILAVNHKSNFDPIAAAAACPRQLTFMAKEELFRFKPVGAFLKSLGAFPISRGRGDVGAVKAAFSILKRGDAMLIFPQGHRMKNGERGKAHNGAVMIAQRMETPVVPLCISGKYRFMSKITVTFGKSIEFTECYGQKLDSQKLQELSDGLLDNILSYEVKGK